MILYTYVRVDNVLLAHSSGMGLYCSQKSSGIYVVSDPSYVYDIDTFAED